MNHLVAIQLQSIYVMLEADFSSISNAGLPWWRSNAQKLGFSQYIQYSDNLTLQPTKFITSCFKYLPKLFNIFLKTNNQVLDSLIYLENLKCEWNQWICRLWHQLTIKLGSFVKEEYFLKHGGLLEVRK